MNNLELYAEIQREINNLDNNLFIPSSEITMALNKAINLYVKNYYTLFESDELSRKRLSKLVKVINYIKNEDNLTEPNILIKSNELFFEEFDLYEPINSLIELKFVVLELATVKVNEYIIKVSKITPISLDVVSANLKNPFKKPYKQKFWRIEFNGKHYLIIPKGLDLQRYTVSYIDIPVIQDITDTSTYTISISDLFDDTFIHSELIPIVVQFSVEPYLKNNTQSSTQGTEQNSNNDQTNSEN